MDGEISQRTRGDGILSSVDGHDNDEKKNAGYSPHIVGAAWGLLFMGLSLAAIIGAWATIGVKGPAFSTDVLEQQQKALRERYGLPPEPELGPEMAEVPPSLRNLTTTSDNST